MRMRVLATPTLENCINACMDTSTGRDHDIWISGGNEQIRELSLEVWRSFAGVYLSKSLILS